MAKAPLPDGARLTNVRFDKGCHDFWECADGPDRPAFLEADVELRAAPRSLCTHFLSVFREAGYELVGATPAGTDKLFRVNEAACAAGYPGSGMVVGPDGRSFNDKAELRLSVPSNAKPTYKVTYERHRPVPVHDVQLTGSQIAHARGALDREFVLMAYPEVDGIGIGGLGGDRWDVAPGTTTLRFEVTCDERDEIELTAKDPSSPDSGLRVVHCTGASTEVDMPVSLKGDKVSVRASAYKRPSTEPRLAENYVVRFISAG